MGSILAVLLVRQTHWVSRAVFVCVYLSIRVSNTPRPPLSLQAVHQGHRSHVPEGYSELLHDLSGGAAGVQSWVLHLADGAGVGE